MGPDPPPTYDDINEAVIDEWVDDTTPAERVRQVMHTTYSPVSAGTVAEQTHTSPKTARKHLNSLANEGFLATKPGERGGTVYYRSQESLVLEQASDILAQVTKDELQDRITTMKERIREFEDQYDVTSPDELVVEDATTALAIEGDERDIDHDDLTEWRTTRRNLAFATVAMSLATAKPIVSDSSDVAEPVANG